jgi:hypothetical protein
VNAEIVPSVTTFFHSWELPSVLWTDLLQFTGPSVSGNLCESCGPQWPGHLGHMRERSKLYQICGGNLLDSTLKRTLLMCKMDTVVLWRILG